ncbi:MAG: twin-arginine translocase subunit TatC [Acidimicrobiia bacterium]|nr:twin-arginine translocase subunit TatC [Acidimicrobiia bacterium]
MQTATYAEHLAEFRSRLIKCVIAVLVGSVLGFAFNEQVLAFLSEPYRIAVPGAPLNFFRPGEAFSIVMKMSLWAGVVFASPVILYQIWAFVSPALTPREKKWAVPLTLVFVTLFLAGITVGYYALARGLTFLFEFGGDNLNPVIGADDYLKFSMRFLLAFGISFEFPVFLFAAMAVGVTTSQKLRSGRRWAVIAILVVAAVITPTGDPLTLMMLSVPMYLLYEAAILAGRVFLKK